MEEVLYGDPFKYHIINYLTIYDLGRLKMVNKHFNLIITGTTMMIKWFNQTFTLLNNIKKQQLEICNLLDKVSKKD